jgi:hypothetical protein
LKEAENERMHLTSDPFCNPRDTSICTTFMTLRNRDILSARLSEDDTATYFFGLEIFQDRLPFDDFFPKKK